MPMGRPCTFKPETGEEICRRLAEGESLNAICKDAHMPKRHTVIDWTFKLPDFAANYARAREAQAEKWADDIVDIADNSKDSNLGRLQVDARKWVVSKLLPKKYGDRVALAGDPEAPLYVAEVPAVAATAGEWLTKHKPGRDK